MFLFYRLTGRRAKRWKTKRGEVKQLQSPGRKFNNKEKPLKDLDSERGKNSKNAQEGIGKDDLLYLAVGEGAPRLPRQMSRHCQRELSPVMIK